jgi:hypothetical protein
MSENGHGTERIDGDGDTGMDDLGVVDSMTEGDMGWWVLGIGTVEIWGWGVPRSGLGVVTVEEDMGRVIVEAFQ